MRNRLAVLTALFFLSLSHQSATAAILQVNFTGSISSVPSELASAFTIGDSVTGSFNIDSDTPDSDSDPAIGLYLGPTDFTYLFGSYLTTADGSNSVSVRNNHSSGEAFAANGLMPSGADVNGYVLTNMTLDMGDITKTVFSDDTLPSSLDIADFSSGIAQLIFQHATLPSASVIADISSFSLTTVPIPAAFYLFGSGLLGLAGMARRKKGK